MMEFNLEKAKAGQALCTRSGRAVRFLKIDRRFKTYPVVVRDQSGHTFNVSLNGSVISGKESPRDVVMLDDLDLGPDSRPEVKFGFPEIEEPQSWIFEMSGEQHGHRCSTCQQWVNYDVVQGSCDCGIQAPFNPHASRILFLESVVSAYEALVEKQRDLVNILGKKIGN
jgi:hypothetical protein